jgi:NNP family nitrate/nitrite transporter-like MFS transporter
MAIVREEFHLTKPQIGNIIIASVSITIFARLIFGWLCDKIGPRLAYTGLLIVGSIPVMCIGFANSYLSFLVFRLGIGVIGASFVITQYHTSRMFAPNIVGTANAVVGGWGNLGGGLAQIVMPLIFGAFTAYGISNGLAWRYSMIIPGVAMLIMAFVYYKFTQDTPNGNILDLKKEADSTAKEKGSLTEALMDRRVWILAIIYGCSFGMEITFDNIAALYFVDKFQVSLVTAGILAGSFGVMNLFARALGGVFSDQVNKRSGLKGRTLLLAIFVCLEGLGVILFSQIDLLVWAISTMVLFALFVKMSNGATYSLVPYVSKKNLGMVSGIVGAGGNIGAIIMGFVFKMENTTYQSGLMLIGICISILSLSALFMIPVFIKQSEAK